jgi:glutathione S-transferase
MFSARLGFAMRSSRFVKVSAMAVTSAAAIASVSAARSEPEQADLHFKYFDARGVLETSRILLKLAGQRYTEERYPLDLSKTPPYGPDFFKAKESGELAANLDRVPILVADGHAIGQSSAIARFLAARVGLYGTSDTERADIDAFVEHLRDIKDQYQVAKRNPEPEARAVAIEKFFSNALPAHFGKLETFVTYTGTSRAAGVVGGRLSLADVALYVFVEEYFDDKASVAAALKAAKCERLVASVDAVRSHPNVAAYLKQRPQTTL